MPWLIGIILALAGMVIVLLALIFSSPNGLVAGPDGSEQPTLQPNPPTGSWWTRPPSPAAARRVAIGLGEQTPGPTPAPNHLGPLEMTYLGRPSAVAPVYLLLRDFSVEDEDVVAQADQGVSSYANAPDGRVSAAVIGGRAVAIDPRGNTPPGRQHRTVTFGWDAEILYAVRIIRDGNDDLARILEIDFVSGATRQPPRSATHPVTGAEQPVRRRSSSTTVAWCASTRWPTTEPDAVGAGCAGDLPHRSGQRRRDRDRASRSCGRRTARCASPHRGRQQHRAAAARSRRQRHRQHRRDGPGQPHPLGAQQQRDRLHPGRDRRQRRRPAGPVRVGPGGPQGPDATHQGRAAFGAEWRGVMCNWGP